MSAEAYSILGHLVENDTLQLDEDVSARICAGRNILARDYLAALSKREQLKRSFDTAFCGIDALLTPTTASVALPLHLVDQTTSPAHFTRFANFLDLCAIALPNGFSSEGLPTSLQLIYGNDEEMLLQIAWAYQNATAPTGTRVGPRTLLSRLSLRQHHAVPACGPAKQLSRSGCPILLVCERLICRRGPPRRDHPEAMVSSSIAAITASETPFAPRAGAVLSRLLEAARAQFVYPARTHGPAGSSPAA